MKVVINKCYGGFGLSDAAQLEIHKRGCDHSKLLAPSAYFGANHELEMARIAAGHRLFETPVVDGKILDDCHRDNDARKCPVLAAVVSEMGEKANGNYSDLKVVEIPDGVEFVVSDYDGHEAIHQKHEVWE